MPSELKDDKIDENKEKSSRSPTKNQALLEKREKSSLVNKTSSTALVQEVSLVSIFSFRDFSML